MIKNKHTLRQVKRQSGLSLIELLISVVVGLFLLAGVVSNFISTQNADVKRDAISEMDANAAEAFRVLRQAISHAGYKSIENVTLEDDMAFYIDEKNVANVSCRNGADRDKTVVKKARRTRDGSSKDFLTVISLADNPCKAGSTECLSGSGNENPNALVYTDCRGGGNLRDAHSVACSTDPELGMNDPMDAKIYNSFWLIKKTGSPKNRTLYCGGSRSADEPIVNDVETIQYLYGVKNDNNNITYRNAKNVTKDKQWPMVASVQVGLLMRSSKQYVLDQKSTKKRYNILNQWVDIADADLRRLFKVYTTTINLENRSGLAIQ